MNLEELNDLSKMTDEQLTNFCYSVDLDFKGSRDAKIKKLQDSGWTYTEYYGKYLNVCGSKKNLNEICAQNKLEIGGTLDELRERILNAKCTFNMHELLLDEIEEVLRENPHKIKKFIKIFNGNDDEEKAKAIFEFLFNDKTKQLIKTDEETGKSFNVLLDNIKQDNNL